jgi:hypothetical protein
MVYVILILRLQLFNKFLISEMNSSGVVEKKRSFHNNMKGRRRNQPKNYLNGIRRFKKSKSTDWRLQGVPSSKVNKKLSNVALNGKVAMSGERKKEKKGGKEKEKKPLKFGISNKPAPSATGSSSTSESTERRQSELDAPTSTLFKPHPQANSGGSITSFSFGGEEDKI